jgi:hypothetical protein
MRAIKALLFLLLLATTGIPAGCSAEAPAPTPVPVIGSGLRMGAALAQPGLAVLSSIAIVDTTPAVSPYGFIGRQSALGMQLVTTGTLAGSWKVEVSCSPTAVPTANTDPTTSAKTPTLAAVNDDPSDITSAFTPTIGTVSSGGSSQYVQCSPLNAGYFRATFTATSGAGTARVNYRD